MTNRLSIIEPFKGEVENTKNDQKDDFFENLKFTNLMPLDPFIMYIASIKLLNCNFHYVIPD